MAEPIALTPQIIQIVGGGNIWQPLYVVLDAARFDWIDLVLGVVFEGATVSPSVSVSMYSSHALEDPKNYRVDISQGQGWILAGSFPVVAVSNTWSRLTLSGATGNSFCRYLRWQASASNMTAAYISITGVGRRFCRKRTTLVPTERQVTVA